MNRRVKLKKLDLPETTASNFPLFYQFIQFNQLNESNPFEYVEYSKTTQSFIPFSIPEKPVSKIIDYSFLGE